jgi:hypothetical protein
MAQPIIGQPPTNQQIAELNHLFPTLATRVELILKDRDKNYNCVAWTVGKTDRWINPGDKEYMLRLCKS